MEGAVDKYGLRVLFCQVVTVEGRPELYHMRNGISKPLLQAVAAGASGIKRSCSDSNTVLGGIFATCAFGISAILDFAAGPTRRQP